jgi:hypothetical protein
LTPTTIGFWPFNAGSKGWAGTSSWSSRWPSSRVRATVSACPGQAFGEKSSTATDAGWTIERIRADAQRIGPATALCEGIHAIFAQRLELATKGD